MQVMIRDKDKKYIVHGLRVGESFPNKINECLSF